MISINVIIFSIYMFCEVYRSHPEETGYPADIRHPEFRFSGQAKPRRINVFKDQWQTQVTPWLRLQTQAKVSLGSSLMNQNVVT